MDFPLKTLKTHSEKKNPKPDGKLFYDEGKIYLNINLFFLCLQGILIFEVLLMDAIVPKFNAHQKGGKKRNHSIWK